MGSQAQDQHQQQFSLRWNNHQMNLLSVFDQLLQNESFVDVTLACDGLSLKAHKVVLSACSPYFQKLLLDNPCQHPIVILDNVQYADLKALVDFMYKGEVNVFQDQLSAILRTAETLKIKGLSEVTPLNTGDAAVDPKAAPSAEQPRTNLAPPSSLPHAKRRRLHHSRRKCGGGTGSASDSEEGETKGNDDAAGVLEGSSSRHRSSSSSSSPAINDGLGQLCAKVERQADDANVDCRPEPRVHEGFSQDNAEPQHTTLEAAVNFLGIAAPQSSTFANSHQQGASSSSASSSQQHAQYHQTALQHPSSSHLAQDVTSAVVDSGNKSAVYAASTPSVSVDTSRAIVSLEVSTKDCGELADGRGGGQWTSGDVSHALEVLRHGLPRSTTLSRTSSLYSIPNTMLWQRQKREPVDITKRDYAMATTGWTEEILNQALEAVRSGRMSITKAAVTFGIPNTTLWQRSRREGIDTSRNGGPFHQSSWTESNLAQALEAVRSGRMSVNKASATYGIPSTTLWSRAKRYGIETSRRGGAYENERDEVMWHALQAVKTGVISMTQASIKYNVPYTTLWKHFKKWEMTGGPLTLPLSMSSSHAHSTHISGSSIGMVGHHVGSGPLHSHPIESIVAEQSTASPLTS